MKKLAMAVVTRKGKVLIQKRLRAVKEMVFEFPGGTVDPGEEAVAAARRELEEETGLIDLPFIAKQTFISDYGCDIDFVIFSAPDGLEPKVINPLRKQTFYWFKPREIPKQDFLKADLAFIDLHLAHYL